MGASSTFAYSSPLMEVSGSRSHTCTKPTRFAAACQWILVCGLCCMTEKGMHIETIGCDDEFFTTHLSRANKVYKVAILSELLDKWYTKSKESSSDAKSASKLFCYCRVKDDESLVLVCTGSLCVFRKSHLKCCGLPSRPSLNRAWFCTDCRKQNILHST